MTFKEWFLQQPLVDQYEKHYSHEEIWEAATLAERERLEKIVFFERKFIEDNYYDLPDGIGQYFGGRLDAYDNVLNAIRNPNE